MNILSQNGYGPSDKIASGIRLGCIRGAILSPRYVRPGNIQDKMSDWFAEGGEIYLDPEFYASRYIGEPNSKLGSLEEWDYFMPVKRGDLITGNALNELIGRCLREQEQIGVSGYIAPNIYIDHADSINAAISMNFISRAMGVMSDLPLERKPLYCSLAIDRDAISDQDHFEDLVDTLTSLDNRPDGFYVLVGGGAVAEDGTHIRSDLYQERVIANWMYLNHVLNINGFKVINGCAEVFSPLLGICGAEACATGWHGSQRQFSIAGYIRPPNVGGQQPLVRYLSKHLLGRIKQDEYLNFIPFVPAIKNELETDDPYEGTPTRTDEILQTWDALSSISNEAISGDLEEDLDNFQDRVVEAKTAWEHLSHRGFSSGVEARKEQLDCIHNAISRFKKLAELE